MTPEDRAWEVVRRAYEERLATAPAHGRRRITLLLTAVAIVAVVVAASLSPPGRAVFERVRRAVGVEHASPALLSLPAPGKLLVVSSEHGGTWIVDTDGARRRIGAWQYASWSPHGRYVVVANDDMLAALDPRGNVRWTLPRRRVASPVWEGTNVDTRIAYLAASGLRVVAGDGTDDRLLDPYAVTEVPAWDPGRLHMLAFESGGSVVLEQVDTRHVVWRTPLRVYGQLVWSEDGSRLAVVAPGRIVVLSGHGRVLRSIGSSSGELLGAAFQPHTHRLAVVVRHELAAGRRSEVKTVDVDHPGAERLLFAGPGVFRDIAWSPNGRWLLVDWPTANQWVFLHGAQVKAVANVRQQFPRPDHLGPMFELSEGWCCQ
jgi:dipeptidyl aminopeptidase/acylaminoacyl peptidase